MSLLLEAILLGECGAKQIMTGVTGLAKVGDLVSDIFFIITLSEFDGVFVDKAGADKVPINTLLAFAIIFTIVGVVFEVHKIYTFLKKFLKERRERLERKDQDDENEEQEEEGTRVTETVPNDKEAGGEVEEREKRPFPLNLILEDLPQLIILCFAFQHVGFLANDTQAETEYEDELRVSVITSIVFTVGTIFFNNHMIFHGRMHQEFPLLFPFVLPQGQ
jgi:hypothetical protein